VNADAARRQLRQRANELGLDFQQAIQYYAMERFLFRLSRSAWAERFIVKGAVMLRVWDAAVARPTRDIDFLGRIENTPEAVRGAVLECLGAGRHSRDVAGVSFTACCVRHPGAARPCGRARYHLRVRHAGGSGSSRGRAFPAVLATWRRLESERLTLAS
jgi:hypothetical protein